MYFANYVVYLPVIIEYQYSMYSMPTCESLMTI